LSLKDIDLKKVKRPSFKGIRLPDPKPRPPVIYGELPTWEEEDYSEIQRAYSKLLNKNPVIGDLVEALDLVSPITGERLKVAPEAKEPPQLKDIAREIMEERNNYSKEEIITRLKAKTGGDEQRAEKGFNLLLGAGTIERTSGGRYCLTGSTPF